ncbi:helix-turn-helix domain-containing protein [Paenisporosarcina indica]|uniref:helix-turn-helix domain-containing protein n=1 Tax=Paenisporosarcina indica TaxID=650093 RepID=UPI00094FC609|nr:RodZ domain-containing protein [Paenisporosarcina indica]
MTELGTRLKEARAAKGYSLDDLQEITKIQKRYLAGIEDGNYSMMPGPFYVRAFIKQYADAVGLSSDELLESYKQELPSSSNEELQQTMTSAPSRRRPISKSSNRLAEVLPMIMVALFIIIAIVIFWYFYQNLAKNNNQPDTNAGDETSLEQQDNVGEKPTEEVTEKEPVVEPEPVEEEPEPTQTIEVGASEGETTNYTLSGTDTFSLKLVARGTSWVAVRDQTGVEPLARELVAGETVTLDLSDVETARIRVGASSQVDVFVNDEKVEYGKPTSQLVTQNMMIQFSKQ